MGTFIQSIIKGFPAAAPVVAAVSSAPASSVPAINTVAPTTPAWTTLLANTNPLSLSDQDLSALMVQLTDCMKPYVSGNQGGGIYLQARAFYLNTANMAGVREAIQRYGLAPCQNTAGSFYQTYQASYYFAKYPLPAADPANCSVINAMFIALQQEQVSVQKSYTDGLITSDSEKYTMKPLADRLSDLQSMYASLNCDVAIQSQATQSSLDTLSAATSQAVNGTGSTPNYLLWGIYAVAGLIIVGGIVLLFKHKKKAA